MTGPADLLGPDVILTGALLLLATVIHSARTVRAMRRIGPVARAMTRGRI
jgi:hypothetical protein